jgi:hypothetical protein
MLPYIRYRRHKKSGGYVPDEITSSDIIDSNELDSINEMIDTEEEHQKEEEILEITQYIGDSNITTDQTNTETDLGTIQDYETFESSEFTTNITPNKNKILQIKDKNIFDQFTNKYGLIKNKVLVIDWIKVKNDYKGIIVNSSVENRLEDAPYLNNVMTSWVANEYKYIDDVILFPKTDKKEYNYTITEPFKAHIIDYYVVDHDKFANINDDITNDKILVITSIKHFDQFTQKYGSNKLIDWTRVNDDYIGIYLIDDKEVSKNRYIKCFYDRDIVKSWVKKGNLVSGVVYMFD